MNKLNLNQLKTRACRKHAKRIAAGLQRTISRHTTVSVERAVLRLMGVDGIDSFGVPIPNVLVSRFQEHGLLEKGAAAVVANEIHTTGKSFPAAVRRISGQSWKPSPFRLRRNSLTKIAKDLARHGNLRIRKSASDRRRFVAKHPMSKAPWLYAIVATGNIHEDVQQARSACLNGADCIAVIRSTAQSLMDYVPCGATTEGFGGTYATQENFRIMRKALDDLVPQLGRYVYLVNYCSGLCMSEIAAMGAMERLDMMLNDAMYGIIFRDINMLRTFVDQHFSRRINAQAGITINTGEDNYLTTADAVEQAHTVPVSDFINEQLALLSGLKHHQLGLGHAFEIDPAIENGFLYELAHAQLIRELFPKSPIKYMPPTKHIDGNIFRAHALDTLFNLASSATGQGIHLTGILTEGIHTPFMQDRAISLENAAYVMRASRDLSQEIEFRKNGIIQKRARLVLDRALRLLEKIDRMGLPKALEKGLFANTKRGPTAGKGLDGVVEKAPDYINPFEEMWRQK